MDQAGRVVRAATALLPVRRSNRHRWGASTVVTSARQRLTFLNRTLSPECRSRHSRSRSPRSDGESKADQLTAFSALAVGTWQLGVVRCERAGSPHVLQGIDV